MLKIFKKRSCLNNLFLQAFILFSLLSYIRADSIVYLKDGSIYIGEINKKPDNHTRMDSKKIIILKTDLGIVKIRKKKIERIVENEKILPSVKYIDFSTNKIIDARLVRKNYKTSLILVNGKIYQIQNKQLNEKAKDQKSGKLKENYPRSIHLGLGLATTTFPFPKIETALDGNNFINPYVNRRLWGLKANLGYSLFPWLQLDLSGDFFYLFAKKVNAPFLLTIPIYSYNEGLILMSTSFDVLFNFFNFWIGFGGGFNYANGKIDFAYGDSTLSAISNGAIIINAKYYSASLVLKQEYNIARSLSISPVIRLSKNFLDRRYQKTNDPFLQAQFENFVQNNSFRSYDFKLALIFYYHL